MSAVSSAARRTPLVAADPAVAGLLLLGLGLADREAFYTPLGAALVVAGVVMLAVAHARGGGSPRPPAGRDLGYVLVVIVFAIVGALAPFYASPVISGLTLAAPLLFLGFDAFAPTRGHAIWPAAALLIAAHALVIVGVPSPQHQDVFRFLSLGSDALLHGQDPYAAINLPEALRYKFTYPPGVLLLVAPFHWLLGDIRWAYVVAEALVVGCLAALARRHGRLTRSRAALILGPLALPRVAQAFYVFSNHEWLLLALAAVVLLVAPRRWALAGVLGGVGIASKQYFVVFPLLFMAPVLTRRVLVLAVAVAALVVLPFLAWDPGVFASDVIGNLANAPDPERVTLWAIAYNAGLDLGRTGAAILSGLGLVAVGGLAWASRRSLAASIYACGLALALFTLSSPFAAYNYYAYALAFMTWGLLLAGDPAPAGKMQIGLVGFSTPVREEA